MGATLKIWDTYLSPATDALLDLGSSTLEFKDLYIDGVAYIDSLGENILITGSNQIQFRDTAIYIASLTDGHLDLEADMTVDINTVLLATDAIYFTQTDGAEKIDSAADGDIDYTAGTSHDFIVGTTEQIALTDGILSPTIDNDIDLGTSTIRYKYIYTIGMNAVCNNNEVVCHNNEIVFV